MKKLLLLIGREDFLPITDILSGEALTADEICRKTDGTFSTIRQLLYALLEFGLIEELRNSTDKRIVRYRTTSKMDDVRDVREKIKSLSDSSG